MGHAFAIQIPTITVGDGAERPVVDVSWQDAADYIEWLNSKSFSGHYRLPSEAEFEYVARSASLGTVYPWGDQADRRYANYGAPDCCIGQTRGADQWTFTAPVGSFPENNFGIHDLIGNVWEYVEDCFHKDYSGAPTSGRAWLEEGGGDCRKKVVRGGAWNQPAEAIRPTNRNWVGVDNKSWSIGFRPAKSLQN